MQRHALVYSFVFASIAITGCGGSKGTGADASGAADAGTECTTEGMNRCEGATYETCMGGNWNVTQQCTVACDPSLGCVACAPNVDYCIGDDVHSCTADGMDAGKQTTCSGSQICSNGVCVDPCADAANARSYIGCEYWAVDLDNAFEVFDLSDSIFGCSFSAGAPDAQEYDGVKVCSDGTFTAGVCDEPGDACPAGYTCQTTNVCGLDAQHSPFAIVVSNPQARTVNVTVSDATGHSMTTPVNAGAVTSLFPQQMGFVDQSLDWTGQGKHAYKVVADAPIVAYQFNPLDNVGVFSNDASLLIPKATFDVHYIALTYGTLERRPGTNDYNGYVTIVAPQDGTMIMVTPTADVRASLSGGAGVITKGTTTTFTLDAFDVLNLEAIGGTDGLIDGPDLSGTVIQSADAKTFGVFAGTEATVIPTDSPGAQYDFGPCCADHLEEMMFPTSTWGKTFAIARSQARMSPPERDLLRIMAQKAGTTLTFTPAPAKGTCGTLDVGQFCEVEILNDTSITSSDPVLVGHYLESTIWEDTSTGATVGSGDPSLAIAVPVEQFRTSYTILIPSQYDTNYVSLVVPMAGTAQIDGNDVTSQLSAFAGTYKGGRISVAAGPHAITCANGCGIEVYGYSNAVSYMFAGGLDLKQIVVN